MSVSASDVEQIPKTINAGYWNIEGPTDCYPSKNFGDDWSNLVHRRIDARIYASSPNNNAKLYVSYDPGRGDHIKVRLNFPFTEKASGKVDPSDNLYEIMGQVSTVVEAEINNWPQVGLNSHLNEYRQGDPLRARNIARGQISPTEYPVQNFNDWSKAMRNISEDVQNLYSNIIKNMP